jgi:hypothetical protein
VIFGLKEGAIDQVLIEGAPEALDLAIGLRPIRPCIAMLDAKLDQGRSKGY